MTNRMIAAALLLFLSFLAPALAQDLPLPQVGPHAAPTSQVQVANLPVMNTTPAFDADAATKAYLGKVSGAARAKSDAYFEGGYGLQVVDWLYALAVSALLLWLQISARIRDWVQEKTRSRTLEVVIYAAIYMVLVTVVSFPLSVYEGFFREHAYGLSDQSFPSWLGDFGINFAVSLVAAMIILPIIYAAIRMAREAWWIWGAGITMVFFTIGIIIYPVFLAPLTNHFAPLKESPLKHDILSLARANGIPADNVYWFDASRQTNKISANVSGFLGTTQLSLNDNLLNKSSHDEILAVLGHEMGHYVLGHTTRLLLLLGLVYFAAFAFLDWGFRLTTGIFGGNWQVRDVSDVAGLPLLSALFATFFFLATPITNTIVRTTEQQADIFGVNAVRKPDAFATAALKLSTYRKLEPGPWEEAIFYDHPSGRTRIETMMRWKKEHIGDPDIRDTAKLP
jgi:STE24 endopeptidase